MDIRMLLTVLGIILLVIAVSLGLLAQRMRPWGRATRIVAIGLAVVAIGGLVLAALDVPASRAPLPSSLTIYYLDGSSVETLEAASAATGTVRWRYTPSAALASSLAPSLRPRLDNGVFYLSVDTTIVALRARDGKQLWATTVEGNVAEEFVAAVDHGVVYVTAGPLVVALRATDGSLLWQTSVSAVIGTATWPAQPVDNGIVYMAFAAGSVATSVMTVYAINAYNGTIRWKYSVASEFASLTVANGMIYAEFSGSHLGTANGAIVALSAVNGSVRWKYTKSPNAGPPTVADGVVYVSDPQLGLLALDAVAGTLLWQNRDVGQVQTRSVASGVSQELTLIVGNGVVYLLTDFIGNDANAAVVAVDAHDGSKQWRTFLDPNVSSMSLAGNMLYAGGQSAYALRTSDGHVVWSYGSREQFYQPVVSGGVVFFASSDESYSFSFHPFGLGSNNFLNALNARTGALYWSTSGDIADMPMLFS